VYRPILIADSDRLPADHGNFFDYNGYHTTGALLFRNGPTEADDITFEEWKAIYAGDTHSLVSDPQFAASSPIHPEDFQLKATSEYVDAGADLGLRVDFNGEPVPQGLAVDIGAFEYASGMAPPTFADVPFDHWAHDYIEALYQAGYVAGCSSDPLMYCPEATMTRAESAVFVERGIHGAEYLPPDPSEQVFSDAPLSAWYAKWVNGLWEDGYTAGCGTDPLRYCPWQEHSRTEGTVFFLRMLNGAEYLPPPPVGLFVDAPVDFWGAKWIEAAYNQGIIPACASEPELRFCPEDPLDRAMAAYMMAQAKGLSVP
jgi:hypothetical protein